MEVLTKEQLVALAHFGDVAHQQQAAGDHTVLDDGQAPAQQCDLVGLVELLDDRATRLERPAGRAVVEAEFGEAHPQRVGGDAHPVEDAHRVR